MGIAYEVLSYDMPPDFEGDIAMHSSVELGLPPEQVYKTLIFVNSSRQYFVFCLPAGFVVSLKKARELTGSSSIDLLKTDNLLSLTGYIRGGVSPIGMRRSFPTFVSDLAQLEDFVYVSGGLRGVSLRLTPADICAACSGVFADFVQ